MHDGEDTRDSQRAALANAVELAGSHQVHLIADCGPLGSGGFDQSGLLLVCLEVRTFADALWVHVCEGMSLDAQWATSTPSSICRGTRLEE